MADRITSLSKYLSELVGASLTLNAEKNALQQAETRIPIINAELIVLRADALVALDKLNQLQGTTLTLADIMKQFGPPTGAA